jgi:hypothetical protein
MAGARFSSSNVIVAIKSVANGVSNTPASGLFSLRSYLPMAG